MKKEVLSRLKFCFNKELNFSRLSSIISFYFCELHPRFDHLSSNILSLPFREANNGRYRIYYANPSFDNSSRRKDKKVEECLLSNRKRKKLRKDKINSPCLAELRG